MILSREESYGKLKLQGHLNTSGYFACKIPWRTLGFTDDTLS